MGSDSAITIVEAAVDLRQIARDVQAAFIKLQDAERDEIATQARHEAASEIARRARVELGRQLIAARREIVHGGWLPFLEKQGITRQRASDWMRLAGYVDDKCPTLPNAGHSAVDPDPEHSLADGSEDAPTLADAGIDKRQRKSKMDNDDVPAFATWMRDVDRALVGLDKMIMKYAQAWPSRSRTSLANTLRSIADRVERLAKT